MNKKKLLAVALAVCLIAILSFTTLAWFTDSDSATNTFTVGSIKIVQHEKQHDENDELVNFEQNKVLMPIVNEEEPSKDPNYEEKIVYVGNTGKNPAYIQTHIAIPATLIGYLNLDVTTGAGWTFAYSQKQTIDGVEHVVYTFRYTYELAAGKETPVLLNGVYLYADVDVKTNPATDNMEFCKWNEATKGYTFSGFCVQDAEGTPYTVNVLVATQAVQAEGFDNAGTALDSAFGTEGTPWN